MKNKSIEITSKEDLIKFLKTNNVDISNWGKLGHKSVDNLFDEIVEKDCLIREGPLREISIAVINLKKQGNLLIEKSQKMKSGFIRKRNKLPREKIKQNENVMIASYRCMKEEINLDISDFNIIKISDEPQIYIKESASYPNLKTKYLHYDVFIETNKLPIGDFTTMENGEKHDPVEFHFWTWSPYSNFKNK